VISSIEPAGELVKDDRAFGTDFMLGVYILLNRNNGFSPEPFFDPNLFEQDLFLFRVELTTFQLLVDGFVLVHRVYD
jgi:hypothetical protein